MSETNLKDKIEVLFENQRKHQYLVGKASARDRIKKISLLQKAIGVTYRDAIHKALYQDYEKNPSEVDITEIYAITSAARLTKRNLKGWMQNHKLPTPLAFLGSSSWVKHEPKGVCLIISPWNFPFNLTFAPLISAIAAGNTVIIKPSEVTPHSSALIAKIVADIFDPSEVTVVEGGVDISTALLKLPFNHIFFTGSPAVGKIVMTAAAKNLTSVTLELGGKSPTIIDKSADLNKAASRIATGKFTNNGQICIAPDYILIHKDVRDKFLNLIKDKLNKYYNKSPEESIFYNRIVTERHHKRLGDSLKEAISKGGHVVYGGEYSEKDKRFLSPTLILDVPLNSKLMEDEIFGPVLPVLSFDTLSEVVDLINGKEKPLALYIYSRSKKNINYIVNETRAGTTCINNNSVHFLQNNIPFGGSNNSGIGKSHGFYGFRSFSNERGFYKQNISGVSDLLTPPFTSFKQTLINLSIKWF